MESQMGESPEIGGEGVVPFELEGSEVNGIMDEDEGIWNGEIGAEEIEGSEIDDDERIAEEIVEPG